jgi:hypothetical protein
MMVMREQFEALASLPAQECNARTAQLLQAESQLEDGKLVSFAKTKARSLSIINSADAQKIISSFEQASKEMRSDIWKRQIEAIRSHFFDFSRPQQNALKEAMPQALSDLETRRPGDPRESHSRDAAERENAKNIKPWWAFWRK